MVADMLRRPLVAAWRPTAGTFLLPALLLAAPVVHAQSTDAAPTSEPARTGTIKGRDRMNRGRIVRFGTIGAMTGAAMGVGYWAISDAGRRGSACQPLTCALPYLTISGAIAGLFLARELEVQRLALAPREGDLVRLVTERLPLPAEPLDLLVRDSLVIVASDSGVLVAPLVAGAMPLPKALTRRAVGLRDLRAITWLGGRTISDARILLGTGIALWELPLAQGPARRISSGAGAVLASMDPPSDDPPSDGDLRSPRYALSARAQFLRRHDAANGGVLDSIALSAPIRAVQWDRVARHWWVGTDSSLVALAGDASLRMLFQLPVATPVRGLALSAAWVVAVAGEAGVMAWERTALMADPRTTPRVLRGTPHFAYDAAFHRDTLYVAGGADGLLQVDLGSEPRVVSSSRQVGFATLLRSASDGLWVGDRGGRGVVRVR